MKEKPSPLRLAAFQIDSQVLFYLVLVNSMPYAIDSTGVNFASIASTGITGVLVYISCFSWFFLWRKKPFAPQSEKMKLCRQEKIRAEFWHSLGQTLIFLWALSFLLSSVYYGIMHLLASKTPPPFVSLVIVHLVIFTINACVGAFISWKITQRMVNAPIEQKKVPGYTSSQIQSI